MQKQKITILALHLDYGGIEKYISLLCKMFDKEYDIEIICTYKFSDKPAFSFSNRVKIKYLITNNLVNVSIKKLIKDKNIIGVIKEIYRRKHIDNLTKKLNIEEIKKINSDYVITTRTYHNELISKYLKNKNIIKIATEHNYHNNDYKFINLFVKSVRNFDYVIHCTKELYMFYKDKIIGPKNIYIPNTIDISNDEKSKLNNKHIVSVGRISPEKGYFDLIDVMELVYKLDSSVTLTICGDGYQMEDLKKYIKSKRLQNVITLTGFIGGKELEDEYIKSSLYVMTSITEAFGLVLLEAMHFGLPCISFDSASGARNILGEDVGILISNRDIKIMASKIVNLLNNKELLLKYQNKSLNKVKEYSIENIYKIWKKDVFKR